MTKINVNGKIIEYIKGGIVINGNRITINGQDVDTGLEKHQVIEVHIHGNVEDLRTNGNAIVHGVVQGDVKVSGNLSCHDIEGSAKVDGNISCKNIGGNASADGNITCGDVGNNASADGNLHAKAIKGNAKAGGNLRI